MPIEMKHIRKSYGEQLVLADFSMSVQEGAFVCLMGASGVGKTTLLSVLAGLTKPDAGEITGMQGRKISMVFQEDRLLEWADAFANVALVLEGRTEEGKAQGSRAGEGRNGGRRTEDGKAQRSKAGDRAKKGGKKRKKELLRDFLRLEFDAVGLYDYEGKPVSELSGGMRRRVAIVRAVCAGGGLLLLDEPFTGLDEQTKEQVVAYLKKHAAGRTVIMVTHDAQDAERFDAQIVRL